MPVVPRRALAAAAGALLLAGCGSGGGASPATSVTSAPGSPSASAGGAIADLPAAQILERAKAAASASSSVHVKGDILQDGERIALDLRIKRDAGAAGSISVQGQQVQIVKIGTDTYLKGDDAFYRSVAGEAAVQQLAGKWIKVPPDAGGKEFDQLTDLSALFGELLKPEGTLAKGDSTMIRGMPAIELRDSTGGSLFVATQGEPLPLRLVGKGGASASSGVSASPQPSALASGAASGQIDFLEYGAPVELTAPTDVVDLGSLTGSPSPSPSTSPSA